MAGMEEEAGGEHEQRVGAKHGRPKDGSEGGGEKKRESEAQELCSCVSVLNNHFCVRGPDTPSEDIQYSKGTGGEEKKNKKAAAGDVKSQLCFLIVLHQNSQFPSTIAAYTTPRQSG